VVARQNSTDIGSRSLENPPISLGFFEKIHRYRYMFAPKSTDIALCLHEKSTDIVSRLSTRQSCHCAIHNFCQFFELFSDLDVE